MDNEDVWSIKLEKHPTRNILDHHQNGSLVVIWRDWDNIIKNHPKMVYVTNVDPREIKGPHLHKKRNSYFVCIRGRVAFIIKSKDGTYKEFILSDKEPTLICIPNNIPSAHINLSKDISSILTLADLAWIPNDNEMEDVLFDDYNFEKWDSSSIE